MDRDTNKRWYSYYKTLSKVANHIAKKEKAGVVYLNKDIDERLKNLQ